MFTFVSKAIQIRLSKLICLFVLFHQIEFTCIQMIYIVKDSSDIFIFIIDFIVVCHLGDSHRLKYLRDTTAYHEKVNVE